MQCVKRYAKIILWVLNGVKMHRKVIESIVAGLALAAITASAKAIIDVQVLKVENKNLQFLLMEVRQDVKYIRNHVINGSRRE